MSRLALLLQHQPPIQDPQPYDGLRSTDARVAYRELEALRGDIDLAAPAALTNLAEPLVERYQGAPTTGDELRLPPPEHASGLTETDILAAIRRFVAVDTTAPGQSRLDVAREAKLHRVLLAVERTSVAIRRQAGEGVAR